MVSFSVSRSIEREQNVGGRFFVAVVEISPADHQKREIPGTSVLTLTFLTAIGLPAYRNKLKTSQVNNGIFPIRPLFVNDCPP